jgi:hypothetical protein
MDKFLMVIGFLEIFFSLCVSFTDVNKAILYALWGISFIILAK